MSLNDVLDEKNYTDQKLSAKLRMLYLNLCLSVPVNFFSASIVFFTLYQSVASESVLNWYFLVIAITLFRLGSVIVYQRYAHHNALLYAFFAFGAILSAISWGFCGACLMPSDNLLQQTVIMVVIAGVSAGALQMFQASFLVNILFLTIVMIPPCLWLFFQESVGHDILAVSVLSYLVFTLLTAWRGYHMIEESLQLRFDNMALIEELSESNSQLVLINRMNESLQTCKELNEAYMVISHSATELFPYLSGGLIIGDTETHQFETMTQWGHDKNLKSRMVVNDCWALRTGRIYLVNDPKTQLLCNHFESTPQGATLCIPQVLQSGVGGVMTLIAPPGQPISHHQQRLANTLNDVIKLSLINIRLLEMLNERSIRDPLTSLYNRRFLEEALPRELMRIDREKAHLCVCMVDIDYFKQFNDRYGHEAGDEVLKMIGKLLTEKIRRNDIVSRLGGEEFVLVFMNVRIDTALAKMKAICDSIKNARLLYREQLLSKITISVGIAEAPIHGHQMQELLRSADEALYLAKQHGRDRIVVFGQAIEDEHRNVVYE